MNAQKNDHVLPLTRIVAIIIAEFNAWEVASDEALQNFEKGLEKL
jgi:hypothetical protein